MAVMEQALTYLAHGGGCGCKLAPSVLSNNLSEMPAAAQFRDLLVGTETADDATAYKIDERTAMVATTDFFMPAHRAAVTAQNAR